MFIINSYTLAIIFCIITMLCWVSWASTMKLSSKDWPFQLYYRDYSLGLVFTALQGFPNRKKQKTGFPLKATLWLTGLTMMVQFAAIPAKASDIIEVLPLTRDIVMLHFYDGYALYHKNGQPRSNERVVSVPLNVAEAQIAGNYWICSADDGTYQPCLSPSSVGRKSKGAEFTWMCQGWDGSAGCINSDPDRVLEHWVYLVLPAPMQSGKTYTISTGTLAGNGSEWTITFDESEHKV